MYLNVDFEEAIPVLESSLTRGEIRTEQIKALIASKIILRRNELHLNQSEFARYMKVSQTMVSKWENGDCNFSLSTICDICDKLSLAIEVKITKEIEYSSLNFSSGWVEAIAKERVDTAKSNEQQDQAVAA